jgi:trypsin
MRLVVSALVLAASATLGRGVLAQEEIKPFGRRIVGGERTDIKQHPWQVALNVKIDGETYLCGGSIIAQRWVLTAAHCFGPAHEMGDVRAKAGVTDYEATGMWLQIERVVVHDHYNRKTQENDIALIKLKSPPAGRVIPPAPASMIVPVGQNLEVTGWGATAEDGATSKVLIKAIVPLVTTSDCNSPSAYNGRIKNGMLCAGHKDGAIDSCQGDSGGPLVWRTPDGPVLVGVVSWGDGCARKLKYGIYTQVSAYSDWIDKTIAADRN